MPSLSLITPHYYPETSAGAKRCTDTAEFLAARGWEVTVITLLPSYPQNKIYDGFDRPGPLVTVENQVKIIRLRPWLIPRANLLLRLCSEGLFAMQVLLRCLQNKSDIIFASSPYMFLGPAGLLASKLTRTKFVWDVRDLTWLYPKATGKKTYGLDKILEKLMLFTASNSNGLSTATEGLLSYFAKRPTQAEVIANGVSENLLKALEPLSQNSLFTQANAVVLYAGLIGYTQNLKTFVEAARELPQVNFTLAGDGPDRIPLESLSQSYQLANVHFSGHLSFSDLFREYARADILFAQLGNDPIHRWAQPSKLWEYMSTGKPVIYAGEGEVVEILERHELALVVPPENPEALAKVIDHLMANPNEARRLGQNGRRFVAEHRHRVKLLEKLEEFLKRIL